MDYNHIYNLNKMMYRNLSSYVTQYGGTDDISKNKIDKKNAIFMMVIINDHYVIGACIAAFCHKKFLSKMNDDKPDLVIMCDEIIYRKYHEVLEIFFDRVEKIELRNFPAKPSYNFHSKYSSWITLSLNKWQIMNYT